MECAIIALRKPDGFFIAPVGLVQALLNQCKDMKNAFSELGSPFRYFASIYKMFDDIVSRFANIPIMLFPVCYNSHWGYALCEPDHPNNICKLRWGDSQARGEPEAFRDVVRGYFVLFYPTYSFILEEQNHCLSILNFEKQRDGFSCGY